MLKIDPASLSLPLFWIWGGIRIRMPPHIPKLEIEAVKRRSQAPLETVQRAALPQQFEYGQFYRHSVKNVPLNHRFG